jgi:IS4 transposase
LPAGGVFELEPDSIVLMDRGFGDYQWFQELTSQGVWFITRGRKNMDYLVAGQHQLSKKATILSDQQIRFSGYKARKDYSDPLRLIKVFDEKKNEVVPIVTNNFALDAQLIADLYKARWQIEIFFKWIKQNLKIKSFLGTSENAVLTQIWIAMCAYLVLSYIKFQSRCRHTLLTLSRIIRETLLDRFSLIDLFRSSQDELAKARSPSSQLELFV